MAKRKTPKVHLRQRAHGWELYCYIRRRQYTRFGGRTKGEAEAAARQWERDIRDGRWTPDHGHTVPTLSEYLERWTAARRKQGIRSADQSDQRIRKHVLPVLGEYRLDEIRPRQIRDLILSMRREGQLAANTIRNTHGALRRLFADARFEELTDTNPATELPRGTLPSTDEHDPRSRSRAPRVYTRDEAETLISDTRIPEDRRVLYALLLLTGMRHGEAAGRRWRDYEPDVEPLGRLTVETQYEGQPLKTGRPRLVPVQPTLAAVLAEWKLNGFPKFFGRHPRPDDFFIPSRTERCRDQRVVYNRLRSDCERVGVPARRLHDARHTFTTLARADGADSFWLERVTHNARGSMLDHYTASHWESLCAAVQCLRLERRRGADVIALPHAAGHDAVYGGMHGGRQADGDSPEEFRAVSGSDVGPMGSQVTRVPPRDGLRR